MHEILPYRRVTCIGFVNNIRGGELPPLNFQYYQFYLLQGQHTALNLLLFPNVL